MEFFYALGRANRETNILLSENCQTTKDMSAPPRSRCLGMQQKILGLSAILSDTANNVLRRRITYTQQLNTSRKHRWGTHTAPILLFSPLQDSIHISIDQLLDNLDKAMVTQSLRATYTSHST